jgi:chromosome segregation ATPase
VTDRDGLTRVSPAEPRSNGASEVGAGVSAILAAAEQAAAEILATAQKKAAQLIHEADGAVGARIQELTGKGNEIRAQAEEEARDLRLAVESYAKSRRREADEEAAGVVNRAEGRAKELLAEAQQRARHAVDELSGRREELQTEVNRLEAHREQLLRGLRELAARISQLAPSTSDGDGRRDADDRGNNIESALNVKRDERRRLAR